MWFMVTYEWATREMGQMGEVKAPMHYVTCRLLMKYNRELDVATCKPLVTCHVGGKSWWLVWAISRDMHVCIIYMWFKYKREGKLLKWHPPLIYSLCSLWLSEKQVE